MGYQRIYPDQQLSMLEEIIERGNTVTPREVKRIRTHEGAIRTAQLVTNNTKLVQELETPVYYSLSGLVHLSENDYSNTARRFLKAFENHPFQEWLTYLFQEIAPQAADSILHEIREDNQKLKMGIEYESAQNEGIAPWNPDGHLSMGIYHPARYSDFEYETSAMRDMIAIAHQAGMTLPPSYHVLADERKNLIDIAAHTVVLGKVERTYLVLMDRAQRLANLQVNGTIDFEIYFPLTTMPVNVQVKEALAFEINGWLNRVRELGRVLGLEWAFEKGSTGQNAFLAFSQKYGVQLPQTFEHMDQTISLLDGLYKTRKDMLLPRVTELASQAVERVNDLRPDRESTEDTRYTLYHTVGMLLDGKQVPKEIRQLRARFRLLE